MGIVRTAGYLQELKKAKQHGKKVRLTQGFSLWIQDCATRSFDPGSNNVHCSSSRMTFNSKELHLHMTMSPTCLSFTFESRWLIKWLCSALQSSDVICLLKKRKKKRQDHHCHQPVSLFDKRSTVMFNRLLLKEYCTILLLWLLQFRQVLGLQRFLNREMD